MKALQDHESCGERRPWSVATFPRRGLPTTTQNTSASTCAVAKPSGLAADNAEAANATTADAGSGSAAGRSWRPTPRFRIHSVTSPACSRENGCSPATTRPRGRNPVSGSAAGASASAAFIETASMRAFGPPVPPQGRQDGHQQSSNRWMCSAETTVGRRGRQRVPGSELADPRPTPRLPRGLPRRKNARRDRMPRPSSSSTWYRAAQNRPVVLRWKQGPPTGAATARSKPPTG